ncbi:MAG: hypothetical protein ACLGIK_13645, partial [Gemmatimonadota bacterium]
GMQPMTDEAIIAANPDLILVMTHGLESAGGVDGLLAAGYHGITIVDLSHEALAVAQRRLGDLAATVEWRADDVLTAS